MTIQLTLPTQQSLRLWSIPWCSRHSSKSFCICYDAQSAGGIASGDVFARHHDPLATAVGHVHGLLAALDMLPSFAHVKAHSGDAWNECADCVAKEACRPDGYCTCPDDALPAILRAPELAWLWMLAHRRHGSARLQRSRLLNCLSCPGNPSPPGHECLESQLFGTMKKWQAMLPPCALPHTIPSPCGVQHKWKPWMLACTLRRLLFAASKKPVSTNTPGEALTTTTCSKAQRTKEHGDVRFGFIKPFRQTPLDIGSILLRSSFCNRVLDYWSSQRIWEVHG